MTTSAGLDRWTNNPQTTLSGNGGSITAGATSMKVLSALAFPSGSMSFYRVLVDSEIIQISGGQATTTWTILRAVEGTVAASHNDGAQVTLMVSAFELNSFRQEFNVVAYGAVGDGIADESTAFQNAINDAHAQAVGGVVFLPPLQFKVVSNLTTYSNVAFVTYGATITGAGAGTVTPLVRWSLTGSLTVPAALTVSSGGAAITGAVSSTSSITGTVLIPSGITGATAAVRYVGGTTTNHPTSGTFSTGDWVTTQDGFIWVCTAGGSPGTWQQPAPSLSYGTNIQALASSASGGSDANIARDDHVHPWTNLGVLNQTNTWTQNNTFNGGITGTILTASQGNITTVGTLTSLTVSGSATFQSTGAFSGVVTLPEYNGSSWVASNGQAAVGFYYSAGARAEARQLFTANSRNDSDAVEGDILFNA